MLIFSVCVNPVLTDDTGLRFQSNMTITQHKAFNQLLNARVVETSHPSYPHSRIAYSHTHELDTFHTTQEKRKIRVTKNEKKPNDTSLWKAVEKVRVADMNVYSPKRCFDWRVSISLENPGKAIYYLSLSLSLLLPQLLTRVC